MMQDQIARLLRFQYEHPEVEFSVLGPGTALKAEVPHRVPIVRLRVSDVLDELDRIYARPDRGPESH